MANSFRRSLLFVIPADALLSFDYGSPFGDIREETSEANLILKGNIQLKPDFICQDFRQVSKK
jgi:hypothetical protein